MPNTVSPYGDNTTWFLDQWSKAHKRGNKSVMNSGQQWALALALHELFRAKPDLFAGHADEREIAARIIADPMNGFGG